MLRLVFILCYCYATVGKVHAWVNHYDQPVHFQCPDDQFLSHVSSMHDNQREDRLDRPVTFKCPKKGFITGMASLHNNRAEDRQFQFRCCEAEGTVVTSCYFTGWANDWDGRMDFTVPDDKILRGMISYHDNRREDRRFQFEICDFDKQY
ncbi:hypothetical protein ACOMHN_011159 [Nucella lapillus]